jgi:hypothetical protein
MRPSWLRPVPVIRAIHTDDKTKASGAVWQLPRCAPKEQERIAVTVSKAATSAADLRGKSAGPSPRQRPGRAKTW